MLAIVLILAVALAAAVYVFILSKPSATAATASASTTSTPASNATTASASTSAASNAAKKKKQSTSSVSASASTESPLLITTLKGHSEAISAIAWGHDNDTLASVSWDKTLRVAHKFISQPKQTSTAVTKINIDYGSAITFTRDSHYVMTALAESKKIRCYQYHANQLTLKHEYQSKHDSTNEEHINYLVSSSQDKYMITQSRGKDTHIYVTNIKGDVLYKDLNSNQIRNYSAAWSYHGHMFAIAAKLGDVKIYYLDEKADGELKEIVYMLLLPNHKNGVMAVGFTESATRAITVSGDNHIHIWHINVRWRFQEDAKLLQKYASPFPRVDLMVVHPKEEADMIALVYENHVALIELSTGRILHQLNDIHHGKITDIRFSPDGSMFATCSYDKLVKVFHSRLPDDNIHASSSSS